LFVVSVTCFFGLFGLFNAFFLVAWNTGDDFKDRFKKGLNLGLMLSAGFYILGYLFVIVESLIRS